MPMHHNISQPLFQKLVSCVSCNHFQVAERSLYLWNNKRFLALLHQHIDVLMPIIFPPLYARSRNHWNRTILSLVNNTLRVLMEMNAPLFEDCTQKYKAGEAKVGDPCYGGTC